MQPDSDKQKNNPKDGVNENWPALIRSVSCYLVVLLHSSAPLCNLYNKIEFLDWFIAHAMNSISRVAVPLFFMVSGALLLDKKESLLSFTRKRAARIAVPWIFWSIIFLLFSTYIEKARSLSAFAPIDIFFGPVYYHLWFLYALLGTYVFIAFIRLTDTQRQKIALLFFTVVWFIASSLIPALSKASGITSKFDLSAFTGYAGYLTLGYLASLVKINRRLAIMALLILVLCLSISIWGTYYLTDRHGGVYRSDFYEPFAPNIVLACASAFLLLRSISSSGSYRVNSDTWLISEISKNSFGIYLIHPIFLYCLGHGTFGIMISVLEGDPLYQVPLVATVTFLLSLGLTALIRRTPVLRYTV